MWRWAFVVVVAIAALGAFMPKLLVSDAANSTRNATSSLSEHPLSPTGCASSVCNRGGPTPASVSGKSAVEWAVLLGVLAFLSLRVTKRLPLQKAVLPPGIATVLFRPPQSLSFR
jgi:hypothetical protein